MLTSDFEPVTPVCGEPDSGVIFARRNCEEAVSFRRAGVPVMRGVPDASSPPQGRLLCPWYGLPSLPWALLPSLRAPSEGTEPAGPPAVATFARLTVT